MKGANRCWLEGRAVILGDPFWITVKGGWLALNKKFVNPQLQAIPRCLLIPQAKAIELSTIVTSLFC